MSLKISTNGKAEKTNVVAPAHSIGIHQIIEKLLQTQVF